MRFVCGCGRSFVLPREDDALAVHAETGEHRAGWRFGWEGRADVVTRLEVGS